MAYNFKRLSEVDLEEEIPGNSALLIESDDEIKRVPLSRLKAEKFDVVIRVPDEQGDDPILLKGDYNECVERFTNYEPLNVALIKKLNDGSGISQLCPDTQGFGLRYVFSGDDADEEAHFQFYFENNQEEESFLLWWTSEGLRFIYS